MKTLKSLIKEHKFDWVNANITDKNFPVPSGFKSATKYKVFHFDRLISSNDAEVEIKKEGWEPATLYHLLEWPDWNDKDWVVALGSVAEVGGYRSVPCLGRGGSGRGLSLGWGGHGWRANFRFLGVKTGSLENKDSALSSLDTLALSQRVSALEKKFEKVIGLAERMIEVLSNS